MRQVDEMKAITLTRGDLQSRCGYFFLEAATLAGMQD